MTNWTRRVVLQRAMQLSALGVATPLAINLAAIGEADEPPFEATQTERHDAKERIGRAGALMVTDGQTAMIDIGTTALEVARGLRGRALTVITSNLAVVDELLEETGIELVLLGDPGGVRGPRAVAHGRRQREQIADARGGRQIEPNVEVVVGGTGFEPVTPAV
mgnify:CR=1 FL=1